MNPVVTVQCCFPYGTPSKHQPFRSAAHMLLLYLNTSQCGLNDFSTFIASTL